MTQVKHNRVVAIKKSDNRRQTARKLLFILWVLLSVSIPLVMAYESDNRMAYHESLNGLPHEYFPDYPFPTLKAVWLLWILSFFGLIFTRKHGGL